MSLLAIGQDVGTLLKQRGETIGVGESSIGGLLSAALLSVPGASAYFVGGAVIYTYASRRRLFELGRDDVSGLAPMSVEMAAVFAKRARNTFGTTLGIAELGATGPTGTTYGHDAGTCVIGVDGPVSMTERITTGSNDREQNMWAFTRGAIALLTRAVQSANNS